MKTVDIKGNTPYFKIHGFNRMKCTVNSLTENNGITPDGIILTAEKDTVMVEYAMHGISNKIFVSKYQLYLPDKRILQKKVQEILDKE